MILIEKKKDIRFKKILFNASHLDDLKNIPPEIELLSYDVIHLGCENFSQPIYDSEKNIVVEFSDTDQYIQDERENVRISSKSNAIKDYLENLAVEQLKIDGILTAEGIFILPEEK